MTDEPRASPRIRITPLELRLYIVTLLAAVYVVAWRAIAGGAEPSAPSATPVAGQVPAAAPTPARPAATWLEDLPPAQRPPLVAPAGWRVVSRDTVATTAPPATVRPAPRVVRAPGRPLRVRTRSS